MCEKHGTKMQTICGEQRCGLCYEESMVGERTPSVQNHPGEGRLVKVYDAAKHRRSSARAWRYRQVRQWQR